MSFNTVRRSVLIKPVGAFCNIRCKYCFYLDKQELYDGVPSAHRMSESTVKKLIAHMFECSDSPTFVWHGGEPTLMGIGFFKRVAQLQREMAGGKTYLNAIQTNGLLLNEEWAEFFKQERYLVGVSLDGPEHVHDHYRIDVQGKGTFSKVLEKAKMLLAKGVQVNVLTTVNDYSAKYAKNIYNFHKKNGFTYMQFMPVVERDPDNPDQVAPFSVTTKAYGKFLNDLFNVWIKDFNFRKLQQKTSIRFFDSLIKKYVGMSADHCIFQKKCSDYLVIEHNGDLYSCDYMVSGETHVGNIHDTHLAVVFNSEKYAELGEKKAELSSECLQCKWLELCYGGCIKDRIRDPLDQGHNRFCGSYQYFFERADNRLEKFAKLYRQNY